jgi:signal peptidase I
MPETTARTGRTERAGTQRGSEAVSASRKRRKSLVREYAEVAVTALILAFLIRSFVIQAFRIPSGSMENTLLVGDFLLVNKFIYGAKIPFTDIRLPAIRKPEPGDIIVFRAPHVPKDFIKRCVAVEGDVVEVRDNRLFVNGKRVDEPYLKIAGGSAPVASYGPRRVPPGHVFMMGDNRNNSQDSRYWGTLDLKRVKGKAFILYWSWDGERHLPRLGRIGDIIH